MRNLPITLAGALVAVLLAAALLAGCSKPQDFSSTGTAPKVAPPTNAPRSSATPTTHQGGTAHVAP